jgi:haloalkane dehalogenase
LQFSQSVPELPIDRIVSMGTARGLSAEEMAAYRAPFPDESFKAGARRFPALVPITPEHPSAAENVAAWKVLEQFDKPFLTTFSDGDPVTRGGERAFQERVPGARHQNHVTIAGAGHFLQEDKPHELAALLDAFIRTAP